MPRSRLIPLLVLVAAALSGLLYWSLWRTPPGGPEAVHLMGHIEATETNLGFKVPGKIGAIHFQEGQWIKAGQVVAELEAEDLRQDVAVAEGRLHAARANLAKLETGYRPQEVREAQAAAAQARADLHDKERDFRRIDNLFTRKVVSAQTRDRSEASFLMAKEAWHRAQEQANLMQSGYRREDIDQGRAELTQAQASLELARTRLGYATITCPVNAVVLVRPVEPGHVIAVGGTVLTVGDLDNVWFEGWIPETDLARVHYEQKAAITTDTYPGKTYPGWVSYISSKAEFTPKAVETFKERITLVYRTKIRVENPSYELKPGMPAEAVLEKGK